MAADAHPPADACFAEVVEHLLERLGPEGVALDEAGRIAALALGSARGHVGVVPHGENSAVVLVWATVVTGVRPTPELVHELLRLGAGRLFAGFHLEGDAVTVQHAFIGPPVNPEQLMASVGEVLGAADDHDDALAHRFAGLTAVDRSGETIGPVAPPAEPAPALDDLVERLGWLERRQTGKARRELAGLLEPGEAVHDLAVGDAGGNGLLVATDRRLLYVPNWKRDEPAEREIRYAELTSASWADAGPASTFAARAGARTLTARMDAVSAERFAAFVSARVG